MKKVSVIVPCYNAEDFIDGCIESLVNQTIGIDQMELIFVNDASTDGTFEKLCEWEQKYPESIMVINCEENGKQGKARNIGLQYASSEYVGYCDSDDIVEPQMYELLYRAAEFQCSDLVVCRSKAHSIDEIEKIKMGRAADEDFYFTIETMEQRTAFLELDINRAVWNKLYRKKMLVENNLYFPEGMIYEDICFSELVKHYANKVYVLEENLYHHIMNHTSTSLTTKESERLDYYKVNVLLIIELRGRGLYDGFAERYETAFLFEYATVIRSLAYMYGYISLGVYRTMRDTLKSLFPNIKKNAIYQENIAREIENSVSLVFGCIDRDITEDDVRKIRAAVKKEQG